MGRRKKPPTPLLPPVSLPPLQNTPSGGQGVEASSTSVQPSHAASADGSQSTSVRSRKSHGKRPRGRPLDIPQSGLAASPSYDTASPAVHADYPLTGYPRIRNESARVPEPVAYRVGYDRGAESAPERTPTIPIPQPSVAPRDLLRAYTLPDFHVPNMPSHTPSLPRSPTGPMPVASVRAPPRGAGPGPPSVPLPSPWNISTATLMPPDSSGREEIQEREPPVLFTYITPFRLLTTACIVGLGVPKAIASYQGKNISVTTMDWIGAIAVGLMLYWLSCLEAEVEEKDSFKRWFFREDLPRYFIVRYRIPPRTHRFPASDRFRWRVPMREPGNER